MSNGVRGQFVWHELMTTDPKAAEAFYTKVVGWTASPHGEPMPERGERYVLLKMGEPGMAGLMRLPKAAKDAGAPPNWMCYIGTPNVDETVRQATGLGAKTFVPPTDIPQIGRFAVLADPQGAAFAVFTPLGGPETPPGTPVVGDFSWHELVTTDHEAALRFYNALFGWEKTESMDMGPMGIYQMYGWKGRTLGGMFNKPPDMQAPPYWLPYARVADVQKAAETVRSLGGKLCLEPHEVPGGDLIVQFFDPQGAIFALHATKKA